MIVGMFSKRKIVSIAIIFVFFVQSIYITQQVNATSSYIGAKLREERITRERQIYREEMKIIIGTPDQIDVSDPVTVYVAGLRDAKASYIKPNSITVYISHFDETVSEAKLTETARVLSTHEGSYDEEGKWVYERYDRAVFRVSDYLYKTQFEPLEQEIDIKITVIVTWTAPWHEILTSSKEKTISIGNWRNFEDLLSTQASDVQATFDEMDIGNVELNIGLNTFDDSLKQAQEALAYVESGIPLGMSDPTELHFYLLNISTITDLRVGSGSYVDKLRSTNLTKYNYYVSRLNEVNQAFIDSLRFLDSVGITYQITYVNYTYEDTAYDYTYDAHLTPNGFNNYTYNVGGYGLIDADWDNEHLEDCSFEFLMEGQYWSGNPYLMHEPLNVTLSGISSATPYYIQSEAWEISNVVKSPGGKLPYSSYVQDTTHLDIYNGYVRAFKSDGSEVSVSIINSPINRITFADSISNGYLLITPKGGYIKSNRSVIVNLMDDMFPLMNRIYAVPRGLDYPSPMEPGYNQTLVNQGVNQYYLALDDPDSIIPPISQLYLYESGVIDINSVEHDIIDGMNYFNITDYFFRIADLTGGLPFWINPLAKPFESLVFDNNSWSDSYDSVYNEENLRFYLNKTYTKIDLYKEYSYVNIPFFSLFDVTAHVTDDQSGGTVIPSSTNPNVWYYKNQWGDWIDNFFGFYDSQGYCTMPDAVKSHADAWTFKYINRDVLGPDAKDIVAEYQLSPFHGAFDYTPVGMIMGGSMILIQNSMANLTRGFAYSYGLLFNVYRRVYDNTISMMQQLINYMSQMNRTESIIQISSDIELLRTAWVDTQNLNLTLLDQMSRKVIDYYSNPTNEYTSVNGESIIVNKVNDAYSKALSLQETVISLQESGKEIDNEMQKLPNDVQSLGLLSSIGDWLEKSIIPFLEKINSTIMFILDGVTSSFNVFSDTVTNIYKGVSTAALNVVDWTSEVINETLSGVASSINQTMKTLGEKFNRIGEVLTGIFWFGVGIAGILGLSALHIVITPKSILIGVLIAIAVGVIAGLVVSHGDRNWGFLDIGDKIAVLGDNIASGLDAVRNGIMTGIDSVKRGMSKAFDTVGRALNTSFGAINNALGKVRETFLYIAETFLASVRAAVSQVKIVLTAVEDTIEKVVQIFNNVVSQVSAVFQKIKGVIDQIGAFIVDMIGKSFNYVLDLSGDIFTQVRDNLEKALLENKAFVKVADTLYPMLVKMRRNAGLIQYATQYGEMNEDLMLKWVDVFQPASIIQSANDGFYVCQLGTEFAQRLYFIVSYNGTLVNAKDISITVQRYSNFTTEFGVEGSGVLETALPVLQYIDPETSLPVEGLYYVDFFQGEILDWFKNTTGGSGIPDFRGSAPEGWYMTVINATYYNETVNKEFNAMWAERTYLFNQKYIEDAFPRIDLVNDGENNDKIIEIVAGRDSVILEVQIANEMWSRPMVSLTITLSSSNGIPISQWEFPEVQLNDEEGDVIKVALAWAVNRYSPSGQQTMIITVQEYNGDKTFITANVNIIQRNSLVNLFYSWEYIAIIGAAVCVSIIGVYLFYRNKVKKLPIEEFFEEDVSSSERKSAETAVVMGSVSKNRCNKKDAMKNKCLFPQSKIRWNEFKKWNCNSEGNCNYNG